MNKFHLLAFVVCLLLSNVIVANETVTVVIQEKVPSVEQSFVYKRCMDVFENSGAVRGTSSCYSIADTAALGESICGLRDKAWTYCHCLPNYEQDPSTERTDFSCPSFTTQDKVIELPRYIADAYKLPAEDDNNCEGTAKPASDVPLPVEVYLELDRSVLGRVWDRLSLAAPVAQLTYGQQQLDDTGDSSALFDSAYSTIWGMASIFGDLIGMDKIFASLSQLADDLASNKPC